MLCAMKLQLSRWLQKSSFFQYVLQHKQNCKLHSYIPLHAEFSFSFIYKSKKEASFVKQIFLSNTKDTPLFQRHLSIKAEHGKESCSPYFGHATVFYSCAACVSISHL